MTFTSSKDLEALVRAYRKIIKRKLSVIKES